MINDDPQKHRYRLVPAIRSRHCRDHLGLDDLRRYHRDFEMTRPADIPPAIWDKADAVLMESALYHIEKADYDDTQEHIARAIIAEMERCAVLADQAAAGYSESASSLPTDHYKVPYRLHRQNAAREIAAAIRKATP